MRSAADSAPVRAGGAIRRWLRRSRKLDCWPLGVSVIGAWFLGGEERGGTRSLSTALASRFRSGRRTSREQNRGGDHGRPVTVLVPDGGGGRLLGLVDHVGDPPDFALLVPRGVGVELDTEHGREHLGREVFGVIGRDLGGLAV